MYCHAGCDTKEILKQVPEKIYGFVSGVGTGGTLMGTGKRLKEVFKDTTFVAFKDRTIEHGRYYKYAI